MLVRVAVPEHHVGPDTLEPALEATTAVNERLIAAGELPLFDEALDAGAVVWRPEPPGEESFDHGAIVMPRRWGDCDDLAPWWAASLRATGEDPNAAAVVVRTGPSLWHAVVERSDGSIDDPSEWAGMPPAQTAYRPPAHAPMVSGRCYVGVWQRPGGTWRARLDVPVAVAGCCDDGRQPCCACSVTLDEADPRLAIAHAADAGIVLGGYAGAASHDLQKLQALAALSRGISQRQLIEHVDPDLLLCAVLLDNTLQRKLQALAPELMRRPVEDAELAGVDFWGHDCLGPYTMGRAAPRWRDFPGGWRLGPRGFVMVGDAKSSAQWPHGMPSAPAPGDSDLCAEGDEAACGRVMFGLQQGMAAWWAGPEGRALKKARAIVQKYKLLHLGITPEGVVLFAREQGMSIKRAAHALFIGYRFQRGMQKYWQDAPKRFWQAAGPEVRAAIDAAAKKLGVSRGTVVQALAEQKRTVVDDPDRPMYTVPWTPEDLEAWAGERGISVFEAIVAIVPDYNDPLFDFPTEGDNARAVKAMDVALDKLVTEFGQSPRESVWVQNVPPEFAAHPASYWARPVNLAELPATANAAEAWANFALPAFLHSVRMQALAQLAATQMRQLGKKTSPRFEFFAAQAQSSYELAEAAMNAWKGRMLEEGKDVKGKDIGDTIKTIYTIAMTIASIIL